MDDLGILRFLDSLQQRTVEGKRQVWDPFRESWVAVTPEELVRQLFLQYLVREKQYNKNRISVEKELRVGERTKRCDILVRNLAMEPFLIVECKSATVPLDHSVFFQIATYNLALQAPFLVLTNGRETWCCRLDYQNGSIEELSELPDFPG
ncbi:MAG: type I restriction enzyme HsdR N-terminal domain-containing protein [Saprospiraceae bacterium]|jgi:hypothetical protein